MLGHCSVKSSSSLTAIQTWPSPECQLTLAAPTLGQKGLPYKRLRGCQHQPDSECTIKGANSLSATILQDLQPWHGWEEGRGEKRERGRTTHTKSKHLQGQGNYINSSQPSLHLFSITGYTILRPKNKKIKISLETITEILREHPPRKQDFICIEEGGEHTHG